VSPGTAPRPLQQRSGSTPHEGVTVEPPRQNPLFPQAGGPQHPRLRRSNGLACRHATNLVAQPAFNSFASTRAPIPKCKAIAPTIAATPPRHARRGQIPIAPAAPSVLHPPRFRALALFRRRPQQPADGLSRPASENLHNGRHPDQLKRLSEEPSNRRLFRALFDRRVGEPERNRAAERRERLEIDDQIELGQPLTSRIGKNLGMSGLSD